MRYVAFLFTLLLLMGCTTIVEKDTYLKYSGYMDGCADTAVMLITVLKPDIEPDMINHVWLDATCMELYLFKLEKENIKPPMERLDRNEVI